MHCCGPRRCRLWVDFFSNLTDVTSAVHMPYRPDIDGLRAVAILSVVIFHAFPTVLKGGFVGVDVFFVISGFLIAGILLREIREGTFSLAHFYARRARRIFPALLLVMGVVAVLGWFLLLPGEFYQLLRHIASGAGFIINFVLKGEAGYFDNAAEEKPLLHLWSLAVEEQYYLVLPLVLWMAARRRWSTAMVLLGLAAFSFGFNLYYMKADETAAFFYPHARLWELLLGSVLACWVAAAADVRHGGTGGGLAIRWCRWLARWPASATWLRHAASVLGLVLIAAALALVSKNNRFPGYWALLPVLGAVLIIAAGPMAVVNRHLLARPLMVWIGLISFPLYLWHWPLLSLARIVEGGEPSPSLMLGIVALSVVLSWGTYALLEKRVRSARRGPRVAWVLTGLLALVGTGALTLERADVYARWWGETDKYLLTQSAVGKRGCQLSWHGPVEGQRVCEHLPQAPTKVTKLGNSDDGGLSLQLEASTKVALLGNSHGAELSFALAEALNARGVGLIQLTMNGCPLAYRIHPGDSPRGRNCAAWHEKAVTSLLNSNTIEAVVISYYNMGTPAGVDDPAYLGMMESLTRELKAAGKQVVLVLQAPLMDRHINYYIRRSMGRDDMVSMSRDQWRGRYAGGYRLRTLVAPHAVVIDPADLLCDDETCYAIRGGVSQYFDDDHMSLMGVRPVAAAVVDALNVGQH